MLCLVCDYSISLTGLIFSRYSYDEGESWHSYKFTDGNERFRVYGILTEPGEKSTVFTIYASYGGSHSWEIVEIDMKPILSTSKIKKVQPSCLKDSATYFARMTFLTNLIDIAAT